MPRLPQEVLEAILDHALSKPQSPPRYSSFPDLAFSHPRSREDSQCLAALALAFGKNNTKSIRACLWSTITLSSTTMVGALSTGIAISKSRTNSHLYKFVQVLHLDVRQYHSSTLARLVSFLPDLDTLCLRASASQAWFYNKDLCNVLGYCDSQVRFKNLEVDSQYLGYHGIAYLLNQMEQLESLKLSNVDPLSDGSPFNPSQHICLSIAEAPKLIPAEFPSLSRLRSLVLSRCKLNTSQLAGILSSVRRTEHSVLSSLVLDLPLDDKAENGQPIVNALQRLIPRLVFLHLDFGNVAYSLDNIAKSLPFDTLFVHGTVLLKDLILPATSFFPLSDGLEDFFIYLNTKARVTPTSLTLTLSPEWYWHGLKIFRETERIVDDHWLRELKVLKITGLREEDLSREGGLDGLEQRITRINKDRREMEQQVLKLKLEREPS
ncbi:uncharacterized protein JCM6883_000553 [Sporobolomyces salmoneus]|uniref:uncharacterized protein n=1 Tax=Sporobolomyces salmoneus TaxID=183962 RepID=UPI0031761AAF